MVHKNVEIKAECDQPDHIRTVLENNDADHIGTDHQLDTYFQVNRGRLKLREGDIENHLIFYERPDQPQPKEADIYLYETEPGSDLKPLLHAALGVRVVVEKRRDIYFIDNVKFHVDEVDGLGSFMEIEAIDEAGDLDAEQLRAQCEHYLDQLEIDDEQLVSTSYSDLLLSRDGR